MLLIGAFWLYRPLRQAVDFSFNRLVTWPALALAVAWGGGFLAEFFAGGSPIQVLALKLGIFGLLFGGFLLGVERADLLAGMQELRRTIWEPKTGRL
jgi:hypothetical protein